MAWMTVTYRCGHTECKQLYGPTSQREYKLAQMGRKDCPECRAKAEPEDGLPMLEGSPKQIAWANDIRERWIASTLARVPAGHPQAATCQAAVTEAAAGQAEAAWWIDHQAEISTLLEPAYRAALIKA